MVRPHSPGRQTRVTDTQVPLVSQTLPLRWPAKVTGTDISSGLPFYKSASLLDEHSKHLVFGVVPQAYHMVRLCLLFW